MKIIVIAHDVEKSRTYRKEFDVHDNVEAIVFMWLNSCLTAFPLKTGKNSNWYYYNDRNMEPIVLGCTDRAEIVEIFNLEGLVIMFVDKDIEVYEAWNPDNVSPYFPEYSINGKGYEMYITRLKDRELVAKIILRHYSPDVGEEVGVLFLNKQTLSKL